MKGVPTKVGVQPKQLVILGLLLAVLVLVLWMNRTPSAQGSTSSSPAAPAPLSPTTPNPLGSRTVPQAPVPARRAPAGGGGVRPVEDFRPSFKLKEGTDVSRIDPTLRLDFLAKLRNLPVQGGSRSIFEFSQPPAPPPPKVAPIKPAPAVAALPKPPDPPAAKPPVPPPPPIPLKFYGYANTPRNGTKRAFFLDGEDIFVAGENDLIRNRYKIIRIGVNSAVVEDTTNKNQQTLPLMEELG